MSQAERNQENRKDAKKATQGVSHRRVASTSGAGADWGSVDPKALVDAVQTVAGAGGAIRFSYTRDGGAYCVGILGDGEPYNDYIKPSDDIDQYLQRLTDNWRA